MEDEWLIDLPTELTAPQDTQPHQFAWQPVRVSLRDPAFGCRIRLAGVGAHCTHWQPFCLVLHWRHWWNVEGKPADGHPCPVPGCPHRIRFDRPVIIFPDVCGGGGEGEDDLVDWHEPPTVHMVHMRLSVDATPKKLFVAPPPLPETALHGESADDEPQSEHELQRRKFQSMPPEFWYAAYRRVRDDLKRLNRYALRKTEQLDLIHADNAELRKTLEELERQQPRASATTSKRTRLPTTRPTRTYHDCRLVARRKITQLKNALLRERSKQQGSLGGPSRTLNIQRKQLLSLWTCLSDFMAERHSPGIVPPATKMVVSN